MTLSILGIGTAVPATPMSQDESVELATVLSGCDAEQAALLGMLYRQTDIARRHIILGPNILRDFLNRSDESGSGYLPTHPGDLGPDTQERMRLYVESALPLAREAAIAALRDARTDPASITHLVTVTCTGFAAPGFDLGLMSSLPLAPNVRRTQVGFMGCHGAFNGLAVAGAFAEAEPGSRVLLCAVEICSVHYHYTWNPKRIVGNALFADGAGAVVAGADGDPRAWRVVASGSCLFPDSAHAMTWTIGNHGFDMTLSAKVPALIAAHLRPWLERWLAGHGLTIAQIGSWAIHPGGPRVLNCVEEALGLHHGTAAVSRQVLREFGNMSSATILFILDRLRKQEAPRPCVALGFGPGLIVEAALLR